MSRILNESSLLKNSTLANRCAFNMNKGVGEDLERSPQDKHFFILRPLDKSGIKDLFKVSLKSQKEAMRA